MKMNNQGKTYEFPDGASYEQISDFFKSNGGNESQQVKPQFNPDEARKALRENIMQPSMAQNIAGGMLHGANSLMKAMPDLGGIFPDNKLNPMLYKEGERPVDKFDAYKTMGLENKPFYTPQGAAQLLGELTLPVGAAKNPINALKSLGGGVSNVFNAFRPAKVANEFMQNLGGGLNSTENAERIAGMVNKSAQEQKAEALAHKENVVSEQGKTKLNAVPKRELPEGNIDQVADIFGRKANDVTPEEAKEISEAIKDYREHGDFEHFKSEAEDIFRHKGLSENAEADLEHAMRIAPERNLSYLSDKNKGIFGIYGRGLKKAHNNFIKNKDFQSAHKLESALGKQIGDLKRKSESLIGLSENGKKDLEEYIHVYKSLRKDMDRLVKDMPEQTQKEWANFKQKYRENYKPYESTTALKNISNAKAPEELKGIGQSEVTGIFKKPDKAVQKILKDFPKKGKDYIIYNALSHLNPNDAKGIVNALNDMERSGEYAPYMSNKIRVYKKAMENKLRNKNALGKIGKSAGYGTLAAAGILGGKELYSRL